jgi:Sulfotransferase family
MAPPVIVLGVGRSGTTLLRVMLDRSSQIAIPYESFFVTPLAHRHGSRPNIDSFVDDLGRFYQLYEWGISPEDVRPRLREGMTTGEAIASVFEVYAEHEGKPRWGDKTPLYMQHLGLLERLFPDARYVHLIRDGRDAALSFLSVPRGLMTEGWGHPRDVRGFACQWESEIRAARSLGSRLGPDRYLELRYERLVAEPEAIVRRACAFAGLEFDAAMLDYVGRTDSGRKEHQQRLNEPPRRGVRDWRAEMAPSDRRAFEDVAGALLDALGYEVERKGSARLRVASYRARTAAWRGVGALVQRSPLWSRRHPVLQQPGA